VVVVGAAVFWDNGVGIKVLDVVVGTGVSCDNGVGIKVPDVVVGAGVRDTTGIGVGLSGTAVDAEGLGAAMGATVGLGTPVLGVLVTAGAIDGVDVVSDGLLIGATVGMPVVSETGGNVKVMEGAGDEERVLSAAGQRSAWGPTCSVFYKEVNTAK
jgi:hypothetical protein